MSEILVSEILPCPFCGVVPTIYRFGMEDQYFGLHHACNMLGQVLDARSTRLTDPLAVWNTRQQYNVESREKLAKWMLSQGLSTGHGDTIEDLIDELVSQQSSAEAMRQKCIDELTKWLDNVDNTSGFSNTRPTFEVVHGVEICIDIIRSIYRGYYPLYLSQRA